MQAGFSNYCSLSLSFPGLFTKLYAFAHSAKSYIPLIHKIILSKLRSSWQRCSKHKIPPSPILRHPPLLSNLVNRLMFTATLSSCLPEDDARHVLARHVYLALVTMSLATAAILVSDISIDDLSAAEDEISKPPPPFSPSPCTVTTLIINQPDSLCSSARARPRSSPWRT
jgi:hypothetical protein